MTKQGSCYCHVKRRVSVRHGKDVIRIIQCIYSEEVVSACPFHPLPLVLSFGKQYPAWHLRGRFRGNQHGLRGNSPHLTPAVEDNGGTSGELITLKLCVCVCVRQVSFHLWARTSR